MGICDWSSNVCSASVPAIIRLALPVFKGQIPADTAQSPDDSRCSAESSGIIAYTRRKSGLRSKSFTVTDVTMGRSAEHTSELQSLMRISYAVFRLKKKKIQHHRNILTND